ncbi:SpoIIIAH-like family protein [Bacillus sp. AGMB 02131]|uniref:SpoIIIAH-like family protein n=1 Tax=Peribacillus faecalis TaxID=2772559 RepID=A0A927HB09_9BACI|nr:SpoIIIAH-like family protein [Peribacillus faecalis]MBD3108097.1 SpoIIIAH-like family protein [Peribacillus faecalis]
MLLKKQTVWLLTMLSLVIVLSVYYVTLDPNQGTNMATTVNNESNEAEEQGADGEKQQDAGENDAETGEKSSTKEVSPTGSDQTFETMRMEVTDERNRLIEELTIRLSNTELTAAERDEANEMIKQLRTINQKETILETFIVDMNFDAAFVQADGEQVKVTVKSDELTKGQTNDIIRLVFDEIPDVENVTVEVKQAKSSN